MNTVLETEVLYHDKSKIGLRTSEVRDLLAYSDVDVVILAIGLKNGKDPNPWRHFRINFSLDSFHTLSLETVTESWIREKVLPHLVIKPKKIEVLYFPREYWYAEFRYTKHPNLGESTAKALLGVICSLDK